MTRPVLNVRPIALSSHKIKYADAKNTSIFTIRLDDTSIFLL